MLRSRRDKTNKVGGYGEERSHNTHKETFQWHSQNEQVTWVQHGHTQCVCNMHLLGDLGHIPTMIFLIIHSEIASEAVSAANTVL